MLGRHWCRQARIRFSDMTTKQTALERTTPTGIRAGRYETADDTLLAFLQAL